MLASALRRSGPMSRTDISNLFGRNRSADQIGIALALLYDYIGLIWLLQGRPVVALTAETASIRNPDSITVYRRYNKPGARAAGR